jgi:hypothetical protein
VWQKFNVLARQEGKSASEKINELVAASATDTGQPVAAAKTFTLDKAREIYLQALITAFPMRHYREMSSKQYAPLQDGLVKELAKLVRSEKLFVRVSPPSPLGALLSYGQPTITI